MVKTIAALGSSFAAGPGIEPIIDKAAMRSGNNYPHHLARKLDARLIDLTVSGATLKNVLDEAQAMGGKHFAPQVTRLPADVDIVTLTGGGNDIGYIGGVMRDAMETTPSGRSALEWIPIPASDETWQAETLAQRFIDIIDKIRETAPHARVLLVEYLTLFGTHGQRWKDATLTKEQIVHHQQVADLLRDAYQLAGKARSNCEVVPIAEFSLGHGLGSDEPWVDGFSLERLLEGSITLHPNAEGMRAVAEAVYERVVHSPIP